MSPAKPGQDATSLRIGLTTASFLPATALWCAAIDRVAELTRREHFAPFELLMTRAALRWCHKHPNAPDVGSVHEVWNPRERLFSELLHTVRRTPQCRGMTPYPMDSIFFANGAPSEQALLDMANSNGIPAVVSCITSPSTGIAYNSRHTALQVHPDLGFSGGYMALPAVSEAIARHGYSVVLDTFHARRRVRQHRDGVTELSPALAGINDPSLGGLRAVWNTFADRIVLIHFQPATGAELREMLDTKRLPPALNEFCEMLQAIGERHVPIVLEISPPLAAAALAGHPRTRALRFGFAPGVMRDLLLRVRDVLVTEHAHAASR